MRAYERLLRYVRFATASDAKSNTCPSTPAQLSFASYLADELTELGVADVTVDENGYVYAKIPSNTASDTILPAIGLIAHMDVSDQAPSERVNARKLLYEGGVIALDEEKTMLLSPDPCDIGRHLIVTDGQTLLGADDKAGIAEIMTAVELLMQNPDIPHGRVCIAFTPDEEIGRSADRFNITEFGADFAYTLDGASFGEISYENFNAYSAEVKIKGKSYHPGDAKNKMINASELAHAFHSMLPASERPEYTEEREGFYHLTEIGGTVEEAHLSYILRDHNVNLLQKRIDTMQKVAELLNLRYGEGTVTLSFTESYRNMEEKIRPHMHLVERAEEAVRRAGGEPRITPIRGGTDGARLSFMGLPCPNLGTGSHNHHGRYEYACVEDMDAVVDMIINLLALYAENDA